MSALHISYSLWMERGCKQCQLRPLLETGCVVIQLANGRDECLSY